MTLRRVPQCLQIVSKVSPVFCLALEQHMGISMHSLAGSGYADLVDPATVPALFERVDGSRGLTANAVAPGYTLTDTNAAFRENPELVEAGEAKIVLGRFGDPSEIAAWASGSIGVRLGMASSVRQAQRKRFRAQSRARSSSPCLSGPSAPSTRKPARPPFMTKPCLSRLAAMRDAA